MLWPYFFSVSDLLYIFSRHFLVSKNILWAILFFFFFRQEGIHVGPALCKLMVDYQDKFHTSYQQQAEKCDHYSNIQFLHQILIKLE